MIPFSDELRLALVLLLNGGVFAAAYRLARRETNGHVQTVCDAFLLYFLVQYVAVGLPGAFGVFTTATMAIVAIVASAGMWMAARRRTDGGKDRSTSLFPSPGTAGEGQGLSSETKRAGTKRAGRKQNVPHPSPLPAYRERERIQSAKRASSAVVWTGDRLGMLACTLFAVGYLVAYAWTQLPAPPGATDALVYHLATAVQWIQTHRLGIYPSWYWNPAASYSPGTGATFMAWWIAPAGNDVFVRYVQLPPLIFLFFLVVRLCRLMGASLTVSGLIAVAATLCRPLFSEAVFVKDDLYVTSFVIASLLSLSTDSMRERAGPWRVGIALGFVLASKYTVLLACPVFLFMVDSPLRARWRVRQWAIAMLIMTVMAAPWYVRNILLTGNPLYPVDIHLAGIHLHGLFGTERDQQLRTAGGVRKMLAGTYHSLPAALIFLLILGWAAAWSAGRSVLRDALSRTAVIGSIATLALFLVASPHHEVRYVFPLIVLWFAACGLGIARGLPTGKLQIGAAGVLAATSAATSLSTKIFYIVACISAVALLIAAIGVGAVLLQTRVLRLKRQILLMLPGLAILAASIWAYIDWHAYVQEYRQNRFAFWEIPTNYPFHAPLWKWVDENVPADATIAYANAYFVYPFYGFDLTRRVVYAPTRRGLHDFKNFPPMGDRIPGDLIVRRMMEVMDADPDMATWLENLSKSGAGYLVVMKHDPDNADLDPDPPELKLAGEKPGVFLPIYQDEAGVVYRIGVR